MNRKIDTLQGHGYKGTDGRQTSNDLKLVEHDYGGV